MPRTEPSDHIPVALPRPEPRRLAQQNRPADVASATSAGLTLILLVVVIAALGAWVGEKAGLPGTGATFGALAGLVGGMVATIARYRDL